MTIVNVLLTFFQENLAYGKQTNQSSTDQGGVSGRGVDGDSTTGFSQGSCTLTTQENNPWWIVDLGQVEPVSEVYIVNRGDSLGNRLSNFEIRVGRLAFLISPLSCMSVVGLTCFPSRLICFNLKQNSYTCTKLLYM